MKFYDAFHGIGGFRLGLEALGFEYVGGCENDKYAVESYKNHFGDGEVSDITKIDPKTLPDFDLFCAGFPCQAFSIAGNRKGFEDTRGTLFFEIARILKAKKPKYFILENVKGLLSSDKGETMKIIVKTLEELGYGLDWKVLNSKDFGLPQNRERIFIIGKLDANLFWRFDWRFKKYEPKVLNDILEKDVDEKYFVSDEKWDKRKNSKFDSAKNSCHTQNDIASTLCARDYKDPKLIKVGEIGKNGQGERIYDSNGIAQTITGMGGGGGAKTGLYEVKSRVRKLTPRECWRIQGFPDSYKIIVSDSQAYKQIGNSLSVPVITAIGRNL